MIFVKYVKEENLNVIKKGFIRFTPLFMYREYEEEDGNNGISDPYDGMGRLQSRQLLYEKDSKAEVFNGEVVVNVDLEGMPKLAVFCLSQYDDLAEMENRYEEMFDRFPESTHCLIIFTPNQFAKDIQSIMPTIGGGTVLYGEQMMPLLEYKNRWEQGLYKRSRFSYQKEFRFIITNSSFDVPFTYKMNNHSEMVLLEKKDVKRYIVENKNESH